MTEPEPPAGGDLFHDEVFGILEGRQPIRNGPRITRINNLYELHRYGLGTEKGVPEEDVRARVVAMLSMIRSRLPRDQAEALIEAIRPCWTSA